jgi:hypothetical protein
MEDLIKKYHLDETKSVFASMDCGEWPISTVFNWLKEFIDKNGTNGYVDIFNGQLEISARRQKTQEELLEEVNRINQFEADKKKKAKERAKQRKEEEKRLYEKLHAKYGTK